MHFVPRSCLCVEVRCVCVYTRSVYPQLQYSVGHADSMLITFVPLTNTVRFLLSVGSSVGTKRFWDFECQHLLPLISTLCAWLRARHLTPSHLFGLFFFFVCSVVEKWKTKKKAAESIWIHRDFWSSLSWPLRCVCKVVFVLWACFVLLCREWACLIC